MFDETEFATVVLATAPADRPGRRLATVGVRVKVETVSVERTLPTALVKVLARLRTENIK